MPKGVLGGRHGKGWMGRHVPREAACIVRYGAEEARPALSPFLRLEWCKRTLRSRARLQSRVVLITRPLDEGIRPLIASLN